ncbi:MAG: rhomboid family intramembrane serine protease [Polyangiaceae bacterium]|nr:rhomboid family intramembrane serine protease [Polyangiaceae bacterium]
MLSILSDPNQLALWLVLVWCGASILRALAFARVHGLRRAVLDVVVTVLLVGAVAALGAWFVPGVAGYLALLVWILAALVPLASTALAHSRSLRRDYRTGATLFAGLALLRPLGGYRGLRDYYRALHWLATGNRRAGFGMLTRLAADPELGSIAQLDRLTADGDWDGARAFAELRLAREPGSSLSLIPRYLRALGELGELETLVATLERARLGLGQKPPWLLNALVFAFAFGGRAEALRELFRGPIGRMDDVSRELWLATAELAAGDTDAGVTRLKTARQQADPVQVEQIDRRLAGRTGQNPRLETLERALDRLAHTASALARAVPGYGSRCFPVATALLTTAVLAGFLAEELAGGSTRAVALERLGALEPERVAAGEWWRVFTALFLHMGPVHLLMNLVGIVSIGVFLERRLGAPRTLFALVVSGSLPMLVHVVLWAFGGDATSSVGVSGSLMGGVGVAGAILLRGVLDDRLPEARRFLRLLVSLVVVQSLVDLAVPIVDLLGHSLGLVVGFLVGAAFVRLGWLRTLACAAPALALVVAGQASLPHLPWRKPPCGPGEVVVCEAACRIGMLEACGALGYKLGVGEDLPVDHARAISLLKRACKGGVAEACNNLGAIRRGRFRMGHGRDRTREAFERACVLGSPVGCRNLGQLLAYDVEDPEQAARGRRLLAEACRADDGEACEVLAALCRGGIDEACTVEQDGDP